ncbi:MAG: hypothetical protein IKP01_02120 [Bacteroidales bacterium]|nr:hypothetical protein [Bacteroidales bacterium]
MKKCEFCGKEGTAPNVRGAKSAAVSLGNYRMAANVDVEICESCADAVMGEMLGKLLGRIAERSDK